MSASCIWCGAQIPAGKRRDSAHCSKRCRQARHRFGRALELHVASGSPRRFAYADPPYPGLARRYYRSHRDYAGEVDHVALIARLVREFPDGWALSTSARALPLVLSYCPPGVRVAAWFRGEIPVKSSRPLPAWEPVIVHGGRYVVREANERRTDALVHHSRPRLTDTGRVVGAKPAEFCRWLFELLGMQPGDELADLYPGSGGVSRAWAIATGYDESRPAAHDASWTAARDVSPAGEHDASARVLRDASTDVLRDASSLQEGDGWTGIPNGGGHATD